MYKAKSSEWIPANDAVALISPHHGGDRASKLILADMLKDGRLDARAGEIWDSRGGSVEQAWTRAKRIDLEIDIEVPSWKWRTSLFWSEDLDLWRWPENRFVLTRSRKPSLLTFVVNVQFRYSQIKSLLPPGREKIGGAPMNVENWAKVAVIIIGLAEKGYFRATTPDDGPPPPRFKNLTDLVHRITSGPSAPIGETQAYKVLGPVYRHFFPET